MISAMVHETLHMMLVAARWSPVVILFILYVLYEHPLVPRKLRRAMDACLPAWLSAALTVALLIPGWIDEIPVFALALIFMLFRFRKARSAWKGGKSHRAADDPELTIYLLRPAVCDHEECKMFRLYELEMQRHFLLRSATEGNES